MNNQLMTPDSAPRDLEALTKQGPFIHRRLGEQLEGLGFKCWANERDKSAFVTASPGDRAQMLLVQLQAYDTARGGAPAAPQAAPQAPAPAPQAAPQAAPPATVTRTPRTAANGTSGGAQAAPAAGGVGNVVELLNAIKGVQGDLAKAVAAAEKGAATAGGLAGEIQAIKGMLAASMKIQQVELGLLYLFGQQVLGAPGEEILQAAVTDGTAALNLLNELTGKG